MKQFISPRELAKAYQVSESSIKRWVDDGLIHSRKTAGGHRRISVNEALRFARQHELTISDTSLLGLPTADVVTAADPTQAVQHCLLQGDRNGLEHVLRQHYLHGQDFASICDGPIRSAFRHIGALWQHQDDGIMIEHRAVDTCLQALTAMRQLLPTLPSEAPCAIGGGPPKDPYLLPSIMASLVLNEHGWRTVNLGPNTPWATLATASDSMGADLVWVTISAPLSAADSQAALVPLQHILDRGCMLSIGGRQAETLAVVPPTAHRLDCLGDLAALAQATTAASNGPSTGAKP